MPLEDAGPYGADKGAGKYPILPLGYKTTIPPLVALALARCGVANRAERQRSPYALCVVLNAKSLPVLPQGQNFCARPT